MLSPLSIVLKNSHESKQQTGLVTSIDSRCCPCAELLAMIILDLFKCHSNTFNSLSSFLFLCSHQSSFLLRCSHLKILMLRQQPTTEQSQPQPRTNRPHQQKKSKQIESNGMVLYLLNSKIANFHRSLSKTLYVDQRHIMNKCQSSYSFLMKI